jgi:hypothetical protein
MSISPNALFSKSSSARSSKLQDSISFSAKASRPTTPAATFSTSLGIKLRGSTGRSIDAWLQKHKKTQATSNSQVEQGVTVNDERASRSSLSQRRGQQQDLGAVVALKSKQVRFRV